MFRTTFLISIPVAFTACGSGTGIPGSTGMEDFSFLIEPSEFTELYYRPIHDDYPSPDMNQYSLPLGPEEVWNMSGLESMFLPGGVPDFLYENGFLLLDSPWLGDSPVSAFSVLSNDEVPVFVSSDVILHVTHILFDQILQHLEEEYLSKDLETLCSSLLAGALERDDELSSSYFAVALMLLDPSFECPTGIAGTVRNEVSLILEHSGFEESPLFGYEEDYSQYIPRGHYTANEALERYFRASMWLGRLTFLLEGGEPCGPSASFLVSTEEAREQTLSAAAIAVDMEMASPDGGNLMDLWRRLYTTTAFFCGFSDDLGVEQYYAAVNETATTGSTTSESLEETYLRLKLFLETSYPSPSIYGGTGHVELSGTEVDTAFMDRTRGFRLLGQRYTPDSKIFTMLVFPKTGINAEGIERTMPSGLDVAAVFGSDVAVSILESRGAFDFDKYGDNLEAMRHSLVSLDDLQWHSTLYTTWLLMLDRVLLSGQHGGYPPFMRTDAWQLHKLSSFLASWAMLRHDTILYVKQSYTPQTISLPPSAIQPTAGFVEPVPEVYSEAAAMFAMIERGLEGMQLLDDETKARLEAAEGIAVNLERIAWRELLREPLTEEDSVFLGRIVTELLSVIDESGGSARAGETVLIADVHTDQNTGNVLEVASGQLDLAIVIYARPDGILEAAAGPVLSYYEFTVPLSDRMTDEDWRDALGSGRVSRPAWIAELIRPVF